MGSTADITSENPNAFYESGLAHAIGKEVIVMSQGRTEPPFDISTHRKLTYDSNDPIQLAAMLRKAFQAVSARYPFEGTQPYF